MAKTAPRNAAGLTYESSTVMLDSAPRGMREPALARWLLGLGIAATLADNVAHDLGQGLIGATMVAWPAVALVGSCELLMMAIRSSQASGGAGVRTRWTLQQRAAELFAELLAADRVPSVRVIRVQFQVGQPRARRLSTLAASHRHQRACTLAQLHTISKTIVKLASGTKPSTAVVIISPSWALVLRRMPSRLSGGNGRSAFGL